MGHMLKLFTKRDRYDIQFYPLINANKLSSYICGTKEWDYGVLGPTAPSYRLRELADIM